MMMMMMIGLRVIFGRPYFYDKPSSHEPKPTPLNHNHNPTLPYQVLSKMMEVLSGAAEGVASPSKWMAAALDEEEEDEMSIDSHSVGTIGEAPSYAYNVRIKSRKILREEQMKLINEKGPPGKSDKAGGGNYHAYSAEAAKGQGDLDEGDYEAKDRQQMGGPHGGGGGTKKGGGGGGVPANVLGGNPMDKLAVPTRLAVKKASTRAQQEEKRRLETEIKQKTLEDKMMRLASRRAKDAGDADGGAIGNLALLLSQKACAERLSTTHAVTTLPPGVTLKDDTMTKTRAFLSTMPSLV